METNYIYFNVEPLRSEEEVGENVAKFGFSVAVTYSPWENRFQVFTEDAVSELCALLRSADAVVGYRLTTFDLVILAVT
jgi:hypothetical protein